MSYNHETYLSPFTWRYGSHPMRRIWSEEHKRRLMRRIWIALATAQHNAGLVSREQLSDLERHKDNVDIDRASELEVETRHDVVAEIRSYAEQCTVGAGIIHWGATSADITDNVDALRTREAALLLRTHLTNLMTAFADRIEETACLPVMAYTHIQPAEPTTLGYRLSIYAQDLLSDLSELTELIGNIKGKGFKGAVGTQATFVEMLKDSGTSAAELEADAMSLLDLPFYSITTQVYPRKQDLMVLNVLAGIASSLHKFAMDFRVMQSPSIGEWYEPFKQKQTGSSAMPFKRNPIIMENVCSLARYIGSLPSVAWDNAALSILERSLDDSANRRIIIAEAFLATEEIILKAIRVVEEMEIDRRAIDRNLRTYGPFANSERLLTALVTAGADRQKAHEWLRENSLSAWESIRRGEDNPLVNLLVADERIRQYLDGDLTRHLLSAEPYIGTASERASRFASSVRELVDQYPTTTS